MRILGSDYDGTFNYGGIDEDKRLAVKKWREKGNVFTLVSGRRVDDLQRFAREHNFECDYFLAYNGAVIVDQNGETVSSVECDGALAFPIASALFDLGAIRVHVGWDDLFEASSDTVTRDACGHIVIENFPNVSFFTQISAACTDRQSAEHITNELRSRFGYAVNVLQNGTCIDIVHRDMNKAKGMYKLLDILGGKYEDVIVVGDNVNDRDMIAEFYSYAMENGVESIKAIAHHVTSNVTELIFREI